METVLHNSKCLLTKEGYLEVYDHKLATRLNRHFRKFDKGHYTFKEGEEAIYKVGPDNVSFVMQTFLTRR